MAEIREEKISEDKGGKTTEVMNLMLEKTPDMVVADKLINGKDITKSDVKRLGMYNDFWIDKLFTAGQETVKYKMAEVIVRPSVMEVKK